MKAVLTIIKKELARIFTNKKLIALLFVPGLMLFIMYSCIGIALDSLLDIDSSVTHNIDIVNYNEELDDYFDAFSKMDGYSIKFNEINEEDIDLYKDKIVKNEIKVLVVLDDLAQQWFSDNTVEGGSVEVFYNGDSMDSLMMYTYITSVFQVIEEEANTHNKLFVVNANQDAYNLAGDLSVNPIASMIPMLLVTFLITGVMSIAIESIAGEKERGTLATILITPISRFKLALGKVLAISVPAAISGLFSFICLVLSLPNIAEEFTISIKPSMIASLGVVIIVTVLLFVVLISMISSLAKSVKEANQFISPFMIIVMIASLAIGFVTINSDLFYLIPVLNSILAIKATLNSTFTIVQFLYVFISNAALISVGIFGLTKMFNSEKIMFG